MSNVIDLLGEAVRSGQILTIRYHGGSKPGALREVMPIQMTGQKAKCRYFTSNAVKDFMIDKIEVVDGTLTAESGVVWNASPLPPEFETVLQIFDALKPKLEAINWAVEYSSDDNGDYLGLFVRLKNGSRRKHPKILLSYEHYAYDLVVLPDGSISRENVRPRTRPWGLRAATTKTWSTSPKAVAALLEAAGLPYA